MVAASCRLRSRTPLGITATFAELCSSFTLLQSTVISPSASLLNVSDEPDDFTKCPVSLSPSVNRSTSESGLVCPWRPPWILRTKQRTPQLIRQRRRLRKMIGMFQLSLFEVSSQFLGTEATRYGCFAADAPGSHHLGEGLFHGDHPLAASGGNGA